MPEVCSTEVESGDGKKAMEEFCGLLIIRLLRASNLPNMDFVGKTDAFCEFTLGDRKASSKTVKNSLNPTWNQTLSLNVRAISESLIVKIHDADRFGPSEFIGQALVPLEDLPHDGQPMGFDLTIQQPTSKRKSLHKGPATVALEITYNPLTLT